MTSINLGLSRAQQWGICLLVMVVMAGLHLAAAAQKSFWEDETVTAHYIEADFQRAVYADAPFHPPLYYVISFVWARLLGNSELAIRSLSVLFACITLLLGFRVTQLLFGGPSAIAFCILMALSPMWLTYGPQARYYALSAAEVMLMALSLLLYQRNQKRRWLAVYVLASTAALYTVYMSFAAHVACWLWWFVGWVRQPNRKRVVAWLLANALAAALFLPWLSIFRGAVQTQTDVPSKPVLDVALNTAKYMTFNVYDFAVGETLSPLKPVAWVGLIAIAVVVLLGVRRGIAGKAISILVLFVALPLFVSTVITLLVGQFTSPPAPNRVLYALPFFVMVLAACLAVLPKRFALVAGTVIAGCYAWGQINFFTNREFMKPLLTVPWKEMMQTIVASTDQSPDKTAVVICDESDYTCFFYAQRAGLRPHGPAAWPQLAPTRPQVVWFIQSNVSFRGPANTSQVLADIRQNYQQETTTNFGAQDESITAFKQRFMRGDAYTHRVQVWRFEQPVQ